MRGVGDGGGRGGEVIDAIEGAVDFEIFVDVLVEEGEFGIGFEVGDVGEAAGKEVVEAEDLVVLGEEMVGEVRADEAGGAGDGDAHGGSVTGRGVGVNCGRGWLGDLQFAIFGEPAGVFVFSCHPHF